jgi:hypothetical protein
MNGTMRERVHSRFVIASLPRSGSTSVARMLSCHRDIRCLIEPFHPRRYQGQYRAVVTDAASLDRTIGHVLMDYNGFKHVWESNGWPFAEQPSLNMQIVFSPERRTLLLVRRNLLRRAVSQLISRRTGFWIGTRVEFLNQLDRMELMPIDPVKLRRLIEADRQEIQHCRERSKTCGAKVLTLYYEDLFKPDSSPQSQLELANAILSFLQYAPISEPEFADGWQQQFDPDIYQWASPDVYDRIPNIHRIEDELGSDEGGWLFR